jgi:hypothetical protein
MNRAGSLILWRLVSPLRTMTSLVPPPVQRTVASAPGAFVEFALARLRRHDAERAALAMFGIGCVSCYRRGRKFSVIRHQLASAVAAIDAGADVDIDADAFVIRVSADRGLQVPLAQRAIPHEVHQLYRRLGVHTAEFGAEECLNDLRVSVVLNGQTPSSLAHRPLAMNW